jgi:hypothetical protein
MFEHTLQTAFSFSFSLCLSFKSRFDNKTQNQKEKEKQNEFYENSYRVEFLLVVDFWKVRYIAFCWRVRSHVLYGKYVAPCSLRWVCSNRCLGYYFFGVGHKISANVLRAGDRNPVLRLRQGYGAWTLLRAGLFLNHFKCLLHIFSCTEQINTYR